MNTSMHMSMNTSMHMRMLLVEKVMVSKYPKHLMKPRLKMKCQQKASPKMKANRLSLRMNNMLRLLKVMTIIKSQVKMKRTRTKTLMTITKSFTRTTMLKTLNMSAPIFHTSCTLTPQHTRHRAPTASNR